MFQKPGPSARELLGVIAFYSMGADENNFNWLFLIVPDAASVFDNFCILSRIETMGSSRSWHRSEIFYAPGIRCLLPVDGLWFSRRRGRRRSMDRVGGRESRTYTSSLHNHQSRRERRLGFLRRTSGSPPYKPQQSILGPKIEALQDNRLCKSLCLFGVSLLFSVVGNFLGARANMRSHPQTRGAVGGS